MILNLLLKLKIKNIPKSKDYSKFKQKSVKGQTNSTIQVGSIKGV